MTSNQSETSLIRLSDTVIGFAESFFQMNAEIFIQTAFKKRDLYLSHLKDLPDLFFYLFLLYFLLPLRTYLHIQVQFHLIFFTFLYPYSHPPTSLFASKPYINSISISMPFSIVVPNLSPSQSTSLGPIRILIPIPYPHKAPIFILIYFIHVFSYISIS